MPVSDIFFLVERERTGVPAVGKARDALCPICHAMNGERCLNPNRVPIPYHTERARLARWAAMFDRTMLPMDSAWGANQ